MPEVTIEIGGRQFEVACQDGEEHYLRSAEKLLDAEASVLQEQIGRMPEPRMLLMSALMLADKTAALQEKLTDAETLLADTRVELRPRQRRLRCPSFHHRSAIVWPILQHAPKVWRNAWKSRNKTCPHFSSLKQNGFRLHIGRRLLLFQRHGAGLQHSCQIY